MAEELIGNCLVAHSGGPRAVFNACLAGFVSEALNHHCIVVVYGGMNGVLGILKEEIMDLAEESQQNIRGLRYTPASALGTCRFKLKKDQEYERILEVFEAHNIRYFFYCGGNDSQDTADKISKLAQSKNYPLRLSECRRLSTTIWSPPITALDTAAWLNMYPLLFAKLL